jgi:DNA-binding MarR family transcriptional regulator
MPKSNRLGQVQKSLIPAIDMHDELACAHTALRKAARQLDILYDEALAPTKLKMTQIDLLSRIDKVGHTDAPTLRALAADLAIRISALTHALRPLVREGLVEVRTDTHDRRIKHAALTKAGRKRLHEGFVLWQTVNRRVEAVLGAHSARLMLELVGQVSSKDFLQAYRMSSAIAGLEKTPTSREALHRQ